MAIKDGRMQKEGRFSTFEKSASNAPEQVAELKRMCERSLYFLSKQFLGYRDWDVVHDDVEKFLRKPARKKALLLPRGHLKTSIVTIGYTIQAILRDANVRILIGNGVWDMSRTFLSEIKAQLEGSQLKYLYGEFESAKWNADEIIVRQRTKALKEPTIKTTGVEAEQTGGHYDLILLDDLTGLQNSQTAEQREKTKRFRRSMINLLEPGGLLIEIGTRWHLDDTFADIFEKETKYYDVMVRKIVEDGKLIFPRHFSKRFDEQKKDWMTKYAVINEKSERIGEIESNDEKGALNIAQVRYGKGIRVEFAGDAGCMDYVDHLKASMPLDEYSAQYLNEPFSSENQLFKPEMFQYWYQRPKDLFIGMAIDLAISEAKTADETAMTVVGMDKDWKLYILDYIKGRWRPSEVVDRIFEMRDKWKPTAIGMETNGFQRTLKLSCEEEMRKRRTYFPIDEIRTGPDRTKNERIKTLEPFYRNGSVFHANWMRGKDLEIQLQTFPKGKRDDIIDSVAMVLPLLHPGSERSDINEQEWTWDWCLRRAKENNQPFRDFFHYG